MPLAPNVAPHHLSKFLEDYRAMLRGDPGIEAESLTVALDSISAAGISITFSGKFADAVADPAAAWQAHQIAILDAIQRNDMQLSTAG